MIKPLLFLKGWNASIVHENALLVDLSFWELDQSITSACKGILILKSFGRNDKVQYNIRLM